MIKISTPSNQNPNSNSYRKTVNTNNNMASLTFRPKSAATARIVEVPPGAVGLLIGKGGKNIKALSAAHPEIKIQGPKRGAAKQTFRLTGTNEQQLNSAEQSIRDTVATWESKAAYYGNVVQQRQDRERARQEAWSAHIQKLSGCEGEGWNTAGSASRDAWRKRQLAKQAKNESTISYKRRPIATKNRFEMPESSDDEEDEVPRPSVAAPRKLDASSAWSKGAPKELATPPAKLTRQTADMGHPETQTEEKRKAEWDEVVANHKPITSWADECSSDEED